MQILRIQKIQTNYRILNVPEEEKLKNTTELIRLSNSLILVQQQKNN